MRRKITVSPYVYILLPAAFLLIPLRWILGCGLAVVVHEWGHYFALRLCKIPIWALEITPFGIRMHTANLGNREGLICSLAGPVSGTLLLCLSRYMPYAALCAFAQTVFNLLPIYPLDGGRALRAGLTMIQLTGKAITAIEDLLFIIIIGASVYLLWRLSWGIGPTIVLCGIFAQKFLANRGNNRYNRGDNVF